jgi:uncharacterized protein (TIGR03435 family)
MQELDDIGLLRRYVNDNSEEAFAGLVARHINKVYSVALRHTRNPHQAEEITQAVFVILAKKARGLSSGVVLSGWLYQTARLTSVTFLRSEIRRTRREQEACMQNVLDEPPADVTWRQIAPLLDNAMAGLNETDRHAVVLRFFDGKSMSEVGTALGATEDAAKKRVSRALEKLQRLFARRGVKSTTAIIAGAISSNSVLIAPPALVNSVTAVAFSKGAIAGTSTLTLSTGALKIMAWTKTTTTVAVGVVLLLAAGTTAVSMEKYKAYQKNLDSWRIPRFGANTVSDAPPQVRILPTKFKAPVYGEFWARPDKWAGVNVPVLDLARTAYNWTSGRIYFPDGEPAAHYDFAATLPRGNLAALQDQIQKTLGLVGNRETMDTNVLVLTVRNPNAPGLKPHTGGSQNGFMDVRGRIICKGFPLSVDPPAQAFGLARYLEMFVKVPVIDETGLNGNYDIEIQWRERNDPDHKDLKKVLLDQLGLELVPANRPVEMLVMEKAPE